MTCISKGRPVTFQWKQRGRAEVQLQTRLTLALDEVGGKRQAPAALPAGMTWYPFYRRLN